MNVQKSVITKVTSLFVSLTLIVSLTLGGLDFKMFAPLIAQAGWDSPAALEQYAQSNWVKPIRAPYLDINSGSRYFGATRSGTSRKHAANDYVCDAGTPVYAMTGGTVVEFSPDFYGGTNAIGVQNDDGSVARYCEIRTALRNGDKVSRGQQIGTVIKNNKGGGHMLHLEMYLGTASGSLTNRSNSTYDYIEYKNYQRRRDLIDPAFVQNLPISAASNSVIDKLISNISEFFNPQEAVTNPFNFAEPSRTLKVKSPMMNGEDVKWLQAALTYCGFNCTVDGYFGNQTREQVISYQNSRGLDADGIVGPNTLGRLKSEVNGKNETNSDGQTSNTSNYDLPSRTLKYTSPLQTGEDVKWLQASMNKLINAGLTVDGMFGKNTYNAVKDFQRLNGLAVDGIVGTNTKNKINELCTNSDYVPPQASVLNIKSIGYPVPTSNLRSGSKGDSVRWLQLALNYVDFADLSVDGHFGPKTLAAVKSYQSNHGLSVDGVCGPQTIQSLKSALAAINIVVGASKAPNVATIEFAEENKVVYANEETISFIFDGDDTENFELVIENDGGQIIYKYVTDEYKHSIALEPGYYSAYVTAKNDKGSVTSKKIEFTVIEQSKIKEGVARINSDAFGTSLAYNLDTNSLYVTDKQTYETMWEFYSFEDWTFQIVNAYYRKELAVENGHLVAEDLTTDNEAALWYLYEENGRMFIKSKTSDLALTISSDEAISLKNLETGSFAQAVELVYRSSNELIPHYTKVDDTHATIEWEKLEGIDTYMISLYDEGDEIIDVIETSETMITFETEDTWKYRVYIDALSEGIVVVGAYFDDDTKPGDTEPSEPIETTEPINDDMHDYYLSLATQLQNYLHGKPNYNAIAINDLDMNLDGVIDIFDLALLKRMIKESE